MQSAKKDDAVPGERNPNFQMELIEAARKISLHCSFEPPTPHCYYGPDALDQTKRPCALKKAVNGPQGARESECQNEPRTLRFERVSNQHRRHRQQTKR
jgi:hypothetical protein